MPAHPKHYSMWACIDIPGLETGQGWSKEKPGGSRRSQEEPERARRSKEEPGGAKRSQEEPGGARSQEEPRGARKSQEEPGGARKARRTLELGNLERGILGEIQGNMGDPTEFVSVATPGVFPDLKDHTSMYPYFPIDQHRSIGGAPRRGFREELEGRPGGPVQCKKARGAPPSCRLVLLAFLLVLPLAPGNSLKGSAIKLESCRVKNITIGMLSFPLLWRV